MIQQLTVTRSNNIKTLSSRRLGQQNSTDTFVHGRHVLGNRHTRVNANKLQMQGKGIL